MAGMTSLDITPSTPVSCRHRVTSPMCSMPPLRTTGILSAALTAFTASQSHEPTYCLFCSFSLPCTASIESPAASRRFAREMVSSRDGRIRILAVTGTWEGGGLRIMLCSTTVPDGE